MAFRISLPAIGLAALLLAGCATKPQAPVALDTSALSPAAGKVGVVLAKTPKAALDLPGAGCLLCLAAAQVANSGASGHVETLDVNEFNPVRDQIADALRKKGMQVVVIPDALDLETLAELPGDRDRAAMRNFAPLRQKYGVDKMVVVSLEAWGLQRNYSAYIPQGAPRIYLRASGRMVNLASNSYEWYLPINVARAADGNWDEPPKYPGLTNAFYQAVEEGKDQLLRPWTP
ncbi:hypothetical protein HHL11_01705 [Ramlibacter sp. G-1-2-2]|uniref:Uncharacterized protein n=1 Tax=Ramlibacter agri TaxID=2728837 RepID=A0A848GV14_9BURK|nr:hypothetical protein [Ramlibacter agri]NML42445.1 hypothetical protein [Ramlibacter agri]